MMTLSRRERVIVGAGAVVALVVGGYLLLFEPLLSACQESQRVPPSAAARAK